MVDYIVNQFSNPLFVHAVLLFFLVASILVFVLGFALVWRSDTALRLLRLMNTWVSTRKLMKPAVLPHFVEPMVFGRPVMLGIIVALAASVSAAVIVDIDASVFRRVLFDGPPDGSGLDLAVAIKWFLLIGNALCAIIGLLLIFSPHLFSKIEVIADKWYSLRRLTYPLDRMHNQLDNWVSNNPVVTGAVLIVTSLGLGVSLYIQMTELTTL